jgi:hypothetical protein
MRKFRLDRRTVLRGAGSIAVALPWLEAMAPEREARAQANTAQRFLAVYTPGGTVGDKWRPTGTETAPILSPILAPLQPIMSKLLIVDGLDMKSAVGEQHQAGIITWLTGNEQNAPPANGGLPSANSYTGSPSIDQMLATRLSANGKKKISSMEMAIRWGTGKAHGLISPISCANFEDNANNPAPIGPRLDPQKIWTELFGMLDTSNTSSPANRLAGQRKSMLDFIDKKYATLSGRLGARDKQKIDEHLTKIRELEGQLTAVSMGATTCAPTTKVDTTGYKPDTGLNSTDNGSVVDISTDKMIPTVGKFMMDMMTMAFACDLTSVGTLQWTDTEAKHTFPFLTLNDPNPNEHHHFYQHDGGFRPIACQQICTWYSQNHLYLLQAMDKVDMGGHTLLDESVVFFGSELGENPSTHTKVNMPFLLAGKGGGIRSGRWVKYANLPHNKLLVTILNLFGDMRQSVGGGVVNNVWTPTKYNSGPLTNIV